jgi:hypothetical protein
MEALMLRLCSFLAFCVLTTSALADEARLAPAAGSTLTYRVITTTKTQDKTIVTGQILAYRVASSDGVTAEGTIKLIALLFDCRGHESEPDCIDAKAKAAAHEENGLTVIPVPTATADRLAPKSTFKLHAFLFEERKVPVPSGARLEDFFNTDDPMIVSNVFHCDAAAFSAFLPLGKVQHATIPCQNSTERSGGSAKPTSGNSSLSLDVSYQGEARLTLPSGDWDVRKLSLKPILSTSAPASTHTEMQFSDKLGAPVKSHSTVEALKNKFETETDSELISVSP